MEQFGPEVMNYFACSVQMRLKIKIQSTLVISKSNGPTKTLRDIRTSTYQICSIEEKTVQTTKFHK